MVHIADKHLASTGMMVFSGDKKALYGDQNEGTPMLHVAKGTVTQ